MAVGQFRFLESICCLTSAKVSGVMAATRVTGFIDTIALPSMIKISNMSATA